MSGIEKILLFPAMIAMIADGLLSCIFERSKTRSLTLEGGPNGSFVHFLPVLLCAAAVAAAQTPAPDRPTATAGTALIRRLFSSQQPSNHPPSSRLRQCQKRAAANKVTYTGCVKPGTAPETWILENAEVAKPGQATAATSGAMKTTLNLTTKVGTDLKPHANHKIEVVGTVAPAKPSADAGPTGSSGVHGRIGQDGFDDLSVEEKGKREEGRGQRQLPSARRMMPPQRPRFLDSCTLRCSQHRDTLRCIPLATATRRSAAASARSIWTRW